MYADAWRFKTYLTTNGRPVRMLHRNVFVVGIIDRALDPVDKFIPKKAVSRMFGDLTK